MLTSLRIDFLFGPDWIFQSAGQLGFMSTPGFVTLSHPLKMDVIAPPLPLAAGPYHTSKSFAGSPADTIYADTVLNAPASAPLTADVTLLFNLLPGLPTVPTSGRFDVHVRVSEPGGPGVFCIDIKFNAILAAFEVVVPPAPAPAISKPGFILVALLLTGVGVLALARRRIRSSGESFR
jgi:hypothetical protein